MDVLGELERAGAVLLDRHFVYKSGKHGSGYINMDPLLPRIDLVWQLGTELWGPFAGAFDTVAAPATGGIALAYATAFSLHHEVDMGAGGPIVSVVWADKEGDDFVFDRAGFVDHLRGKRVLVVEDLLTTGGSVLKVCRRAVHHGAEVVGVSAICNRGGVTAEQLGVSRLESLVEVNFDAVEPDQCPLCADAVPIVEDIGHGSTYKFGHAAYPGGYVKLLPSA